jgi:hypothetical protein
MPVGRDGKPGPVAIDTLFATVHHKVGTDVNTDCDGPGFDGHRYRNTVSIAAVCPASKKSNPLRRVEDLRLKVAWRQGQPSSNRIAIWTAQAGSRLRDSKLTYKPRVGRRKERFCVSPPP